MKDNREILSRQSTKGVDGNEQSSPPLSEPMRIAVCDDFIRCMDGRSGSDLTVAGERIPVSERYDAEVRKRYQQILFEGVD